MSPNPSNLEKTPVTKTAALLARREKNVARGVLTAHPVVAARAKGALAECNRF